jgi:MFS family permease
LGTLLTGIGFGAVAFAASFWGVAATVVIWTFGEMITFPGSSAAVADMSPPDRRGEYMGLYTMSFGVAFAVGPWLGTLVLTHFGFGALWAGAFAMGCLSALLMTQVRVHPAQCEG